METSCELETFYLHAYITIYRVISLMLSGQYHQRYHHISFENCHFTAKKLTVYCINVGVFTLLISDPCLLTFNYTSITLNLVKTFSVKFSFGLLFLLKNIILSIKSLYNVFLSLLMNRPVEEKICSDGTDVAGTASLSTLM